MAIFYPKISKTKTDGELAVLHTLRECLPDSWSVFYEPLIGSLNPDVVVFSPYYGFLIIEVKDYSEKSIIRIAPDYWGIDTVEGFKNVTSPFKQVTEYAYKLINLCEMKEELKITSGVYSGKLSFPVAVACWFTNLTIAKVKTLKIDKVIPLKMILTKDNFHDNSICESIFIKLIEEKFTMSHVDSKSTETIIKLLYPTYVFPEKKEIYPWQDSVVNKFSSITDEILFVSTEVRSFLGQGVALHEMVIYFDCDKPLKHRRLTEEVSEILKHMGIETILGEIECDKLSLLSLESEQHLSREWKMAIIIEVDDIRLDEKKETFLESLLRKVPNYFVLSSI